MLLELIGSGGMAEVYRARMKGQPFFARGENPKHFTREVAVKLILPHLSREDSFRELFSREAHMASLLDHPNIIGIQDYGTLDETDFIVMEYIHGMDLRGLLKAMPDEKPVSLGEAVHILYRISRGLEYAHGMGGPESPGGIIHRDLSPHNILISTEGEIKIADFGIARAVLSDATWATAFKGKLSYMSPEQVEGKPLDHRSDIFSLGIIAHQILSGRHPFTRGSDGATLKAVQNADFPPISSAAGIPASILMLVESCLAVNPSSRPASAGAIAAELEPLQTPKSERILGQRVQSHSKTPREIPAVAPTSATITRPKRYGAPITITTLLAIAAMWVFLSPTGIEKPAISTPAPSAQSAGSNPPDAAAQSNPLPAQKADYITISTSPPGARIIVNGNVVGRSPARISLDKNRGPLIVSADLYGYRKSTFSLDRLEGDRTLRLTPLPRGEVRIGAIPWAQVFYRGNLKGYTPIVLEDLPVGKRTFVLKNGQMGVTREITVEVGEGKINTVNVDLAAN